MHRSCANPWCKQAFEISAEERALRQKVAPVIAGKVMPFPEPTLCPDCRLVRRMLWRNERYLQRRTCDFTKKSILSVYPSNAPFPVIGRTEWFGDAWDATSFGRPFDFSRSFFEQYRELLHTVPRSALNGKNTENCDYCNFVFDSRNCYLSYCIYYSESLLYSYWGLHAKDCVDCAYIFESEQCYQCSDCNHSYGCVDSTLCHTCTDCHSCYDCRGCTSCFGCVGLRQRSYCLFNEQLTKDEYLRKIDDLRTKTPAVDFRIAELKKKHPHQHSIQEKTERCTGDYVYESQNCTQAFQAFRSKDCIFLQDADDMHDCLDNYHCGWSQLLYEVYSPVRLQRSAFITQCWDGSNLLYCDTCQSCSDCFGCIGLTRKRHCILNKQYTQEEYEKLVPKIVEHMTKTREWGEFFPMSSSPFAYNETMAQEYYPLPRKTIEERGWHYRDIRDEMPDVAKVIPGHQLPDDIADVPDDILNWAITCDITGRPFRIIKQELAFYRGKKLPVPRIHPDERHRRRMLLRNPRKLWDRKCAKCQKSIVTSYAPERPERVVCEECYLKEAY
jgi:hypothetical protein